MGVYISTLRKKNNASNNAPVKEYFEKTNLESVFSLQYISKLIMVPTIQVPIVFMNNIFLW